MGAAQSRSTPQQQAELDEALLRAVKSGDEAAVTSLHAAGASLDPSTGGLTSLAAACDRPVETAGMARLLLRLGADPDKGGAAAAAAPPPAQLAAARGHADTVAALLAAGADGTGVVEAARAQGHVAVVRTAERELALGGEARRQRQQQQRGETAAAADGQQQEQAARRMQWIGLIIEAAVVLAKALWQVFEVHVHVDLTEKAPENATENAPDAGTGASGTGTGTGGGGGGGGTVVGTVVGKKVTVRLGVQVPLEALDTPGAAPAPGSKSITVTYNCANANAAPAPAAAGTSSEWHWSSASSSAAAASSIASSSRAAAAQGPQPAAAGAAPAGGGGSSRSSSTTRSGTRAAPSAPPAPPAAAAAAGPSAPSAPPMPPHLDDGTRVSYPAVDTSPVDAAEAAADAGEEEEGRCLICCDAQAEAACVPCGHLVGCMNCLAGIRARGQGCPVCRAPIQQLLRVFQG